MALTLGPAICLYGGVWSGLALVRALTLRRGGWSWQWRGGARGRYKLEFTGWALVWEWRLSPGLLPRSRSVILPQQRHQQRQRRGKHDGPTLAVSLFWLGQVAIVLFLAWNAVVTLRDSHVGPWATPTSAGAAGAAAGAAGGGGLEHRRLSALTGGGLHIASRMRPMAFLLPSSSSSGDVDTTDWRNVWLAALIALAVHEFGHARAAAAEGVPVQCEEGSIHLSIYPSTREGSKQCHIPVSLTPCSTHTHTHTPPIDAGVYLALFLPGAYVLIPESIKTLPPWPRLRVLVAGVAANAALCLGLALLLAAGLPTQLIASPDPNGGAVVRSLPPRSPLGAAIRPGDGVASLQDVPISDGVAELVSLLRLQAETTQARYASLLHASTGEGGVGGEGRTAAVSLASLNATVTRLVAEASLPKLEAAGLLPPEALCTHLDLTEGEDEEERWTVPGCCRFEALVGRPPATDGTAATTCFAYLPAGERGHAHPRPHSYLHLHLTCLPARELALHSHVVGLGAAGSAAARGDRGRPFCFRPLCVPPNILLKVRKVTGKRGGRGRQGKDGGRLARGGALNPSRQFTPRR
jgi:hypothetical protein